MHDRKVLAFSAAAPSAPVVPVGWKPRAFVADGCKAAATLQATSNPATMAVTNRLPLIPRSSASARLGENGCADFDRRVLGLSTQTADMGG
jgi:hypothetical protein